MKFILGKKLGMTQIFSDNERVVPVTLIEAGPVEVTQIRTDETDGYRAIQIGFVKREKNIKKPQQGHAKKHGVSVHKHVREVRLKDDARSELKVGDTIVASVFEIGDRVQVTGVSKGKGFQGSVKRHGFAGGPASHGHRHALRQQGSVGGRFPQHSYKGLRMPGRMGGKTTTQKGLKVVMIDVDQNIIAINGAIPGPNGTVVKISTAA